ncbi:MAG: DNA polymerase [Candidatus Thermoplasmatota archaeon]|nr:DNA polymerase [Candidatus Thermoplasmatota archaeon]
MVDCYTQVLKPRKVLKPIPNPTIIALDTEFDKTGLISLCFSYQSPIEGHVYTKLYVSKHPTITIESLYGLILKFCRAYDIPVGKTIYLVSHFAQSELQHIPDLWKKLKIKVFHKSMCGEWETPEGYECSGELNIGKVKLKIIDTYAHFLCGLDKIAKSIGMEKVSLEGVDNQPESFWKQNMKLLMLKHKDVFEKYAKQDSEILIRAFNQRRQWFLENFNIDILKCVTLAQTSSQVFSTRFLTEPIEPLKFEWTSFNRKSKSGWRTGWRRTWVYDGSKDKRYFAMKCYWGGRREAFYRGLINEPVEVWDVKQMYPTMAKLPLPNKDTEWHFLEGCENLQNIIDGIGFVYCKFSFPEETEYPCLPVFDSRFPKLIFPLEGESWATTYELKLALKLRCKVKDVKAWVFYPTTSEKNHPLKSFMEYFTKLKNQNPEGSMPYETCKLVMNALIGKFCQRDPEYSIETYQNVLASLGYDYIQFQEILKHFETRQKFKNPINVGSSWSPEWSSLILGSSRAIISEIMSVSKAITGHTDSVIIFKGAKVNCEALNVIRGLGSDLEHKTHYDSDKFWICRSAVYSPIKNGNPIKPTHHGYPTDSHEQFGEIIKANLKAQKPIINNCFKTHLVTPKEALRTGQKLGSQITKNTKITWEWDYKRRLHKPEINLWFNYSPSKPWGNINEILQALNKIQPLNQKWKNGGLKGRPNSLTSEHEAQISKLRQEGLSVRQIAEKLNLSKDSVHRFLKTVSSVSLCANQYTHF